MQQERHTCSEISYRITDVECIARAKTFQLNLTGTNWMIRNEKLCEGNLSTSLLEGSIEYIASDAALADCENRAQRENETKLFGNGMVVLGLATSHCRS